MTRSATSDATRSTSWPSRCSAVVIGVDDAGGRDAAALARVLAPAEARMLLANVWPATLGIARAAAGGIPPSRESKELLLRTRLDLDVVYPMVSRHASSVAVGLRDIAAEEGAGLVVVGAHATPASGHTGTPDDTHATLRKAHVAVAVAPHGYADHDRSLARVAVAMLGDEAGLAALDAGRAIAQAHGARLEVARVLDPLVAVRPSDERAWLAHADAVRAGLEGLDADAVHVREGDPAGVLAELAGEVDLLVLGAKSGGHVRHLLLGSTAATVAGLTAGALLVVPRAA